MNTLNKIGEESSWNRTLINLRVRSSFGQLIKSLAASNDKINSFVNIDNVGLKIAVQMLNRCQRFCSPGVGDANTDQQRRKRCENSNLENGL